MRKQWSAVPALVVSGVFAGCSSPPHVAAHPSRRTTTAPTTEPPAATISSTTTKTPPRRRFLRPPCLPHHRAICNRRVVPGSARPRSSSGVPPAMTTWDPSAGARGVRRRQPVRPCTTSITAIRTAQPGVIRRSLSKSNSAIPANSTERSFFERLLHRRQPEPAQRSLRRQQGCTARGVGPRRDRADGALFASDPLQHDLSRDDQSDGTILVILQVGLHDDRAIPDVEWLCAYPDHP